MQFLDMKKSPVLQRLTENEHAIMAVLAVIVGLAAGFGAVGFRYLIDAIQKFAYGSSESLLETVKTLPWYLRVLIPTLGGMVVGPLVYFGAREAKGHGVPEVMEAVTLRNGFIRKRLVVIKSLASAITIGTGGSVGREGPIVQIGSAIGSTIGQWVRVSGDRMRTLVGCGAAAGVAATFNAPIAGSMFALEVILGDFGLARFSPIIISSVTATAISRHYLGDFPAFIVPQHKLVSFWEFPLYVLLGLFCAIVAVTFTRVLYRTEDLFDDLKFPDYLKGILGGAVLGLGSLLFPQLLGVGYAAIDASLMGLNPWWLLLLLIPCKILATSITIGSGGSGGIFAPSLFLGAMAGSFFGFSVHSLFPSVTATPGAYGLVGMAAVVGGTTHGPLTAMLIIFEMTGDYKIILPLMITCIVSTLASGQFLKESIYTLKLIRRGIDIRAGKEVNVLKSIPVSDVMNSEIDTIPESLNLGKLAEKISGSKYTTFPVVDTAGKLSGMLSYVDYQHAVFDENLKDLIVVKELASPNVTTVSAGDNLYTAFERISARDYATLPVVDENDPTGLVGILTRRDIIGAYTKAVIKKSLLTKPGEGK